MFPPPPPPPPPPVFCSETRAWLRFSRSCLGCLGQAGTELRRPGPMEPDGRRFGEQFLGSRTRTNRLLVGRV